LWQVWSYLPVPCPCPSSPLQPWSARISPPLPNPSLPNPKPKPSPKKIGEKMQPQAIIALISLGMIGFMILISKVFTRLWLYCLLLAPSWAVSGYDVLEASFNGEPLGAILANHATGLIFVLSPIDQHVVSDPSLCLYGVVLLAIWFYIVLVSAVNLLGGWMLPLTPLVWWVLGKGLPNTFQLLTPYLPSWLLAFSGLPLILLICALIGVVRVFAKRKR